MADPRWIHLDARLMSAGIVPDAAATNKEWLGSGTHELLIRGSPPWNEHAPAILTTLR